MQTKYTAKQIERFWSKIDKETSTIFYNGTRCWEWAAYRQSFGHGVTSFSGKLEKAHRASWIISFGDIPSGICVLHRCDNPACVRPEHLFLGTRRDNVYDMVRKGRQTHKGAPHDEGNGNCKLSRESVNEILRLSAEGSRRIDLARKFGVSSHHISNIVNGKRRSG